MTNYAQIPTHLICRFGELTKTEIVVVSYLYATRNRKTGQCNPSRSAISRAVGIDRAHVSPAVRSLDSKGWICEMPDGNFMLLNQPDSVTESAQVGGAESAQGTESALCEIGNKGVRNPQQGCAESVTRNNKDSFEQRNEQRNEHTQDACANPNHEQVLDGIRSELGLLQLPNEPLWLIEIERATKNGFTLDHCLETFRLMRRQHWRTGPIKPSTWAENLPNIENLRREQNGTNRPTSEREKSAQRTINAELMADAIGRGDEEAVRRILASDGQGHLKGYLPS